MKDRRFSLSAQEKARLESAARDTLLARDGILFAYAYGSFAKEGPFRDIDIAVYLDSPPDRSLESELVLEQAVADSLRPYPVDLRILNQAPLSFRYNVIRHGRSILGRCDARADFEEATIRDYCDFMPYRARYLKETLGRGIQPG